MNNELLQIVNTLKLKNKELNIENSNLKIKLELALESNKQKKDDELKIIENLKQKLIDKENKINKIYEESNLKIQKWNNLIQELNKSKFTNNTNTSNNKLITILDNHSKLYNKNSENLKDKFSKVNEELFYYNQKLIDNEKEINNLKKDLKNLYNTKQTEEINIKNLQFTIQLKNNEVSNLLKENEKLIEINKNLLLSENMILIQDLKKENKNLNKRIYNLTEKIKAVDKNYNEVVEEKNIENTANYWNLENFNKNAKYEYIIKELKNFNNSKNLEILTQSILDNKYILKEILIYKSNFIWFLKYIFSNNLYSLKIYNKFFEIILMLINLKELKFEDLKFINIIKKGLIIFCDEEFNKKITVLYLFSKYNKEFNLFTIENSEYFLEKNGIEILIKIINNNKDHNIIIQCILFINILFKNKFLIFEFLNNNILKIILEISYIKELTVKKLVLKTLVYLLIEKDTVNVIMKNNFFLNLKNLIQTVNEINLFKYIIIIVDLITIKNSICDYFLNHEFFSQLDIYKNEFFKLEKFKYIKIILNIFSKTNFKNNSNEFLSQNNNFFIAVIKLNDKELNDTCLKVIEKIFLLNYKNIICMNNFLNLFLFLWDLKNKNVLKFILTILTKESIIRNEIAIKILLSYQFIINLIKFLDQGLDNFTWNKIFLILNEYYNLDENNLRDIIIKYHINIFKHIYNNLYIVNNTCKIEILRFFFLILKLDIDWSIKFSYKYFNNLINFLKIKNEKITKEKTIIIIIIIEIIKVISKNLNQIKNFNWLEFLKNTFELIDKFKNYKEQIFIIKYYNLTIILNLWNSKINNVFFSTNDLFNNKLFNFTYNLFNHFNHDLVENKFDQTELYNKIIKKSKLIFEILQSQNELNNYLIDNFKWNLEENQKSLKNILVTFQNYKDDISFIFLYLDFIKSDKDINNINF